MSRAALIERGRVIGLVYDAPEKGYTVDVAGCFTANGDPVNVSTYKISRSKANMRKAEHEQPVSKVGDVWTFQCVEGDEVCY